MDREFFTYSPITARPLFKWPGGARIALWVVPNIEHYEYLPGPTRMRNPWPRMPHPDVLGYSLRDYGNRVGVWRMLDVMDKHEIRCTVSLNLAILRHVSPRSCKPAKRADMNVCHGIFNTSYLWNMPEDEERAYIADCVARSFGTLTGRQLRGWFSPAATYTLDTPDLVAEAGFTYSADPIMTISRRR